MSEAGLRAQLALDTVAYLLEQTWAKNRNALRPLQWISATQAGARQRDNDGVSSAIEQASRTDNKAHLSKSTNSIHQEFASIIRLALVVVHGQSMLHEPLGSEEILAI